MINSEKPTAVILTGDFNARSSLFWEDESTDNIMGRKLGDLMLCNHLDQVINEATHFP